MGGAEERAPAQQHTGLSVAPQLAHSEHLQVIVTPSLHDSNDYIVSDTNMIRNVGGISLKNKVRTNERLDEEFRLYKYSNTRCDRNSR